MILNILMYNREEKVLAKLTDEPPIPDFKSRTSRDLMRIVEDQVYNILYYNII